VCVRLGIEYLWIEALCIVQDDKEDWTEQCPKMAQIYQSAYITIAGASSMGCQESFLAAPRQSPIVIETETADGYPSSVYIRRRIRGGINYNEKETSFRGMHLVRPGSYGQVDPLEKRGWTLQAQDLASRRVVYISGEVQWVCRTMTRCECFPERRGPGRDFVVTPKSPIVNEEVHT
jgi:heterokaryon incompatibility protein (HET)